MPTMQAWLCEQPTGVESVQWKSLPLPIRSSQNEAFWFQMLRVSSFKSTDWEVFSAVIACVFLSGRFSVWVERSVFERCNSFHTVFYHSLQRSNSSSMIDIPSWNS